MNASSRSLKLLITEEAEEPEELPTRALTVASLAFWFGLLLKLDDVVLFIVPFVLVEVLVELPLFVFSLAPFPFGLAPFLVVLAVVVNEVVVFELRTCIQPNITTSRTTQMSTLRAISLI